MLQSTIAMIHCRRDFSFSYLNFCSFELLLTRGGCFFWCIINITISKKHLYFHFPSLASSLTHFVITTTTTTTCHHHQQHPQTVPVVTLPSTTTNGKLHAHLLSE